MINRIIVLIALLNVSNVQVPHGVQNALQALIVFILMVTAFVKQAIKLIIQTHFAINV